MHQIIRAAAPIFTAILSWYFFSSHFSRHRLLSLVPVVLGVGLATYGDYYCTFWGFVLTLLGTVLAALKTIATNALQSSPSAESSATSTSHKPSFSRAGFRLPPPFPRHRLSIPVPAFPTVLSDWTAKGGFRLALHPLDLLTRISPLALVQCAFYAHISGELDVLQGGAKAGQGKEIGTGVVGMLLVNGGIAFALNVVSFEANRRAGALSMGVAGAFFAFCFSFPSIILFTISCHSSYPAVGALKIDVPLNISILGNVKQVLTILCAVSLFRLTITPANALGIAFTLLGGAWYALVQYREKKSSGRRISRSS